MTIKNTATAESALVPLVIGAIGHRDLRQQDVLPLENRVRDLLRDICARYPHSPKILLSALAEGADRVVARVALELNFSLVVPLPFEKSFYREDFTEPESKQEFDSLIARATSVVELSAASAKRKRSTPKGETRDDLYLQAGKFITQYSQILIALWDGVDSERRAGTAQVVKMKIEGIPVHQRNPPPALSQIDSGPVYHIVTPHIGNPAPRQTPYSLSKHYPEYWGDNSIAESVYERIMRRIDTYNKDVKGVVKRSTEEIEAASTRIISKRDQSVMGKEISEWIHRFAVSDVLAGKHKISRVTSLRAIIAFVVVGFFFLQNYLEIYRSPFLFMFYPGLLAVGAAFYWVAKRNEYELKHEDYRALAEALRVQTFWKICRINEDVTDHYLYKHKGELEWIKIALRTWQTPVQSTPDQVQNQETSSEWVSQMQVAMSFWTKAQEKWFRLVGEINLRKLRRTEAIAGGLYIIGIVLSIVLLVMQFASPDMSDETKLWEHITVVAMVMALAVSAALHTYVERLAFSDQSKQYNRMASLFHLGNRRLSEKIKSSDLEGARKVMRNIGHESLVENGDWLLLHRSRPLELPRV